MSNEVLMWILGGAGVVIAFFMNKALTKIDKVADDVTKLLAVHGITDEKVKSHEEQINFLHIKQHDNAEKWTELWKDYDLHSIKHK